MDLLKTMPGDVCEAVRSRMDEGEDVVLSLPGDIDAYGEFVPVWLVASSQRLLVVPEADGGKRPEGTAPWYPAGVREFPVKSVKSAKVEALVGCSRLTADLDGRLEVLLYFTEAHASEFAEAGWALERLAAEGRYESTCPDEVYRCKRCGRLLPERGSICPACVNKIKVLRRALGYLRPYKKTLVAVTVLSLLNTLLFLIPPQVYRMIIDGPLSSDAPIDERLPTFFLLIGVVLGVYALGMVIQVIRGTIRPGMAFGAVAGIRSELFERTELLPLRFFDQRQVGAIMSRFTNDANTLQGFLVEGAPELVNNLLMILGITVILMAMDPVLGLLVLLPVPVLTVGAALFWHYIHELFHRWMHIRASFAAFLNESISGIPIVKAFTQESGQQEKFENRNVRLKKTMVHVEKRWGQVFPVIEFFMAVGTVIVWCMGGYKVLRAYPGATLGKLVAFTAYLASFYAPMRWFSRLYQWMARALSGAERIFEFIDSEPEPYDSPDAVRIEHVEGNVVFDRVYFGYDKSKPVLQDISFEAKAGEMIGLVGRSGAGKSTTIKLICRFYDADRGRVLIDGVDITKLSLHDLRRQIGVVPQEPFLFEGTIAENIAFGTPGAGIEDIMEAARAANAHDFICMKPDGYDTLVGEGADQLSTGEKQRISIARAVLRNPRILILDEATSSVDSETEKQIQEALNRLVKNRTTFAIAHRLSTLRQADRLVVLEGGRIKEMGTHDELLKKEDGVFRRLVELQTEMSRVVEVGG